MMLHHHAAADFRMKEANADPGAAGRRRKMKMAKKRKSIPYEEGKSGAIRRKAALRTYNAAPPDDCRYEKGTPEEAEYDRGWKDQMAEFARRGDY
jgi:hypothetical protein